MRAKFITKKIHNNLDNFLQKEEPIQEVKTKAKEVLKKNDGLIERVDVRKKMYITEDNRELLND